MCSVLLVLALVAAQSAGTSARPVGAGWTLEAVSALKAIFSQSHCSTLAAIRGEVQDASPTIFVLTAAPSCCTTDEQQQTRHLSSS